MSIAQEMISLLQLSMADREVEPEPANSPGGINGKDSVEEVQLSDRDDVALL